MILVSIYCAAYNHSKYIRQCLDSILIQKTNFEFEILINDDCSTDSTTDIIREYEQKYPQIIKPIYQTENQLSMGKNIFKNFIAPRINSKYLAICEGDDYWTDENKLQKQVDFLEANPDYTVCFHKVKKIYENDPNKVDYVPSEKFTSKMFNFDNLIRENFIQTNSVMYRWNDSIKEQFPDNILPGDWYLHLLFAKDGKIKYIDEVMSVYRINDGSIWGKYKNSDIRLAKYPFLIMNFYLNVYNNIAKNKTEYYYILLRNFANIKRALFRTGHWLTCVKFVLKYPNLFCKNLVNNIKLLIAIN